MRSINMSWLEAGVIRTSYLIFKEIEEINFPGTKGINSSGL